MLLSEMVRRIRSEEFLVNDASQYQQVSVTDWVTKTTKTVVLNEDAIIWFTFSLYYYSAPYSGSGIGGNARLLVDGIPVCSTGEGYVIDGGSQGTLTASGFIYLSAGQHTFDFQVSVYRNTRTANNYVRLQGIQIKKICFSDSRGQLINSGAVNAPNNAETTVIDSNITFPSRRLAAGRIKQVPARIIVYAEGVNGRYSVLKNPGESNDSGKLNWRLFINNIQVSWTGRRGDNESSLTDNITYSEGAYGYYETVINADQTVNIKLKVYNATGSSLNVRAIMYIFMCPWIIGAQAYEPLNLTFPQGSTLYLVLEPLNSDPTKTIQLGGARAWDLGYNYYNTASGTGILYWNYTFESVEVGQCVLLVSGNGGCISIIAVDVRA
ncbi:MAG: hypothetical protein QXJ46_06045 [Candidatus Bathyarchaeia archaeon]